MIARLARGMSIPDSGEPLATPPLLDQLDLSQADLETMLRIYSELESALKKIKEDIAWLDREIEKARKESEQS